MPQNPYMTVYGGAKMYAGSYVVNPYTTLYGDGYQTLYGDGGGMSPFGASEPSDAKKYKHLLKLMAHKIRLLKKLRKAGSGQHASKLKKELASVQGKITHLKKLLADKGVDTSQAEATAGASVSAAGDSESVQLPDGRRVPRKLLRHMRGQRQQGAHPGHPAHPRHPQHAAYVHAQQSGDDHMQRRHPQQRQSQGPISAEDVQTAQAVDQSDLAQDIGTDLETSLSGPFAMLAGLDLKQVLLYGAIAYGVVVLLKKSKKR